MGSIKNHHDWSMEQASDIEIFSRMMSGNTFSYAVTSASSVDMDKHCRLYQQLSNT
jgi:hypothetical protein